MAGLIALLVGYLMALRVRRNGSKNMRYKYLIFISRNNNKIHERIFKGQEFEKDELGEFEKKALKAFKWYSEKERCYGREVIIQLVKAETDNWYWGMKNIVKEKVIG